MEGGREREMRYKGTVSLRENHFEGMKFAASSMPF